MPAIKQPCRASLCRRLSDSHHAGGVPLQQGSQDQSHPQYLRFCFPAEHQPVSCEIMAERQGST